MHRIYSSTTITRVPKEFSIHIEKDVCPLIEELFQYISSLPHRLKLSFSKFIMVLVINNDRVTSLECVWVDVGFIVYFQALLDQFYYLDFHMMIHVCLFQSDQKNLLTPKNLFPNLSSTPSPLSVIISPQSTSQDFDKPVKKTKN